jgi:hypothetical protein
MAIKSEERSVGDFHAIDMRGEGTLIINQISKEMGQEQLVIEADESILPRLRSRIKEGRLILGFDLE